MERLRIIALALLCVAGAQLQQAHAQDGGQIPAQHITQNAAENATQIPAQNTSMPTVLVLGDSLSAAYGIPRSSGWVTLLQQKLTNGNVVNASISGDTTDGGLARLPALLQKYRPAIVVLELGGNDGLRGFQTQRLRANLEKMIQLSQASNAKVLLLGMKIPPNYGLRYTTEFYESYTQLAHQYNIALVPFFLQDVATHPELVQADGIHPRAEAQQKLLDNVWPYLQKML